MLTAILDALDQQLSNIDIVKIYGRVVSVKGTLIESLGLSHFVSIGSVCAIKNNNGSGEILCEVVGFSYDNVMLMAYGELDGVGTGSLVRIVQYEPFIKPDLSWQGRVIDGFTNPIDDRGPLKQGVFAYNIKNTPPAIQSRSVLGGRIDLGVRAIDTFLSCCYGQRMGVFSGSGIGKSILIAMLTRYAHADVKVIGLIGERSREIKEFINDYLTEEGLKQAVIIAATGDQSPLIRRRAAYTTMAVAEYFRDQGKEVLCIIDSVTRFAMAQREIGLAIGEPPTSRGYTPSVFSELPKLLERAGTGTDGTHITGLFAVLVEGDDQNEPISDAARGILDGHIVLDRSISERGRYPAINVLKSVSRAMPKCNTAFETALITRAKQMLSLYQDMAEIIRIGAYKKGTDPELDQAIDVYKEVEKFLSQAPHESTSAEESYKMLAKVLKMEE